MVSSQWCPPGEVLCCICFHCRPKADLFTDDQGQTWDVCKGFCALEAGLAWSFVCTHGKTIMYDGPQCGLCEFDPENEN